MSARVKSKRRPGSAVLRRAAPQFGILLLLGLAAAWLWQNVIENLTRRGISMGFDFLDRSARFPISESILSYSPSDNFVWAVVVGIGNSLFVSGITIALATLLGLPIALARRSGHPLAYALSSIFIDVIRNTPLIVQLLFCYGIIIYGLPTSSSAANPLPGVYLSDRGLYLPGIIPTGSALPSLVIFAAAAILSAACWTGRIGKRSLGLPVLLGGCLLALLALLRTSRLDYPVLGRFNFEGGFMLSPEFVAILLGLLIYSTAFVAEIIRGGIDAVPRGQWEAGRAIGLSDRQTLHSIILPQALRVIIPPMTSQYINIIKNSTLALVVGYPELNFVIATMINQTGQAVEGVIILMAAFLVISLTVSWLMNRLDRRIALIER
jgi:general L-amino acid transport system permease protein